MNQTQICLSISAFFSCFSLSLKSWNYRNFILFLNIFIVKIWKNKFYCASTSSFRWISSHCANQPMVNFSPRIHHFSNKGSEMSESVDTPNHDNTTAGFQNLTENSIPENGNEMGIDENASEGETMLYSYRDPEFWIFAAISTCLIFGNRPYPIWFSCSFGFICWALFRLDCRIFVDWSSWARNQDEKRNRGGKIIGFNQ